MHRRPLTRERMPDVTGDFTEWSIEGVELIRGEDGVWRADLPLAPGLFEYKFIVDGVWKIDPHKPESVRNSYGQLNSVLTVPSSLSNHH